MSITCKICNTEFSKIIPWQHLKTHNISTPEYKEKYGPVYSPETLAKFENRIPHNKGKKVTDPMILEKQRAAIKKREERFRSGEFNRGVAWTAEQRYNLSQKQTEYSLLNPEKMIARSQKAIQTKIKNGYDFGSAMRGKKQSDKSKEASRQTAMRNNAIRSQKGNTQILEKIASLDLELKNDITEKDLQLHCKKCNTDFTFTKQNFHPSKFKETICPSCFPRSINKSIGELEIYEYVKSLSPDAISGYRSHYHSNEIDVYVPSTNVGFEHNGLYWHSEGVLNHNNKSEKADYLKQKEFAKKGIRIISIFSDEWEYQKDIVKSRIANLLGKTTNTIYARRCQIKEISSKEASLFCKQNHIMGAGRSNIRFGLFHNAELVSVMTFSKSNISRKISGWELNRFASKLNTSVIGGASRLFAAFIKQETPASIVTYADNRWSTGNLYRQLGFTKQHNGTPNYWYFKPGTERIHRFSLRKNKNDKQELTEYENRLAQGYLRIWDCGSSKWVWTSKK